MGRIYDAVYGYTELDEIEFKLVNSPIFQRLHWIKQLGPLNTVFPSAQHSRFSHSIGVFHIMQKMIKHLQCNDQVKFFDKVGPEDIKILRLAALLHDIGHVPLSHIGESVLKKTCPTRMDPQKMDAFGKKLPSWKIRFDEKLRGDATKLHECLSAEIILSSEEIDRILSEEDGWKNTKHREEIKEKIAFMIIGKPDNQVFRALLHSELDADRLDYLLRDSFFTGVGYGHVDLDYIISRFKIVEDEDGQPILCLDKKGLHTVEHYILARFFLHTQVIFDRRVKFLDLAFEDVMKYLVLKTEVEGLRLMGLDDLVESIRGTRGDGRRKHEHRLYEYTDAEVYVKMRRLHDELDKSLRGKQDKEPAQTDECMQEKAYINDCTKIIMDGKIPRPCVTHQKLVSVGTVEEKEHIKEIAEEVEEIAKRIADENGIFPGRIKTCILHQDVMKHTERSEDEVEEDRLEAVKIDVGEEEFMPKLKPAAKSNASILGGLIDKLLLAFSVYYVPARNEDGVANKEAVIKEGFHEFVSKYFQSPGMPCGCEEGEHLCQVIRGDNGLEEALKVVSKPKFICRKCGRVACGEEHLCDGMLIDVAIGAGG